MLIYRNLIYDSLIKSSSSITLPNFPSRNAVINSNAVTFKSGRGTKSNFEKKIS